MLCAVDCKRQSTAPKTKIVVSCVVMVMLLYRHVSNIIVIFQEKRKQQQLTIWRCWTVVRKNAAHSSTTATRGWHKVRSSRRTVWSRWWQETGWTTVHHIASAGCRTFLLETMKFESWATYLYVGMESDVASGSLYSRRVDCTSTHARKHGRSWQDVGRLQYKTITIHI